MTTKTMKKQKKTVRKRSKTVRKRSKTVPKRSKTKPIEAQSRRQPEAWRSLAVALRLEISLWIYFKMKNMDPWIHGSAAGAAARAAAGAAAGAAASAAPACIYYVIIGEALRATVHVHDEIHTAAEAAPAPVQLY